MIGLHRVCGRATVLLCLPLCLAQDPANPRFEVASVKVSTNGTSASRFRAVAGGLEGRNVVLKLLLNYAYGVDGFNISGGPGWIESERFDIQAKAGPDTPDSQLRMMMQALLADRFQLQVHRETRESRVFVLAPAKGGMKLQPLKEGSCVPRDPKAPPAPPAPGQKPVCGMHKGGMNGPNIAIDVVGMDSAIWVRTLSNMLGRTVINETGLSGPLDALHFEYNRDDLAAPALENGAISISTALNQQLGLTLDTARRPVEVLIIDRIEKPSAN